MQQLFHRVGRFVPSTSLCSGTVLLAALCLGGAASQAQQATVSYDLDDVWLLPDDTHPNSSAQQMTGRLAWTYTVGDFENGSGIFSELYIPFSGTALGPLDIEVETKAMEFVLQDDYHDLGVDVSLKFTSAFTESSGSPVDVVLSKWQVEVGTITAGHVIRGSVIPTCWSPLNYGSGSPGSGGFTPTITSSGGEQRIGNDTFQIDCDQVRGGSTGVLILGFGQVQLPALGIDFLVSPIDWMLTAQVASGTPGAAGAGTLGYLMPIPDDLLLVGAEVDFQMVALDPGAPLGPISASDGLSMNLCVK